MFYETSCSCQEKYQTMEWRTVTKGVNPGSRYNLNSLSLTPSSLQLFFHVMNPKEHPGRAVLPGLQQAPGLVLIEIIAWYEAETPLCLFSYSYHGVTGWRTDSSEILQGAERWKRILLHGGFNPRWSSRLLETVCCVLSTATVTAELCVFSGMKYL